MLKSKKIFHFLAILQLKDCEKEFKKHSPRPPLVRGGDLKSLLFVKLSPLKKREQVVC